MELIEHQNHLGSLKFDKFIGRNYDSAVKQSIESLLESLNKPSSSSPSFFTSKFLELMQIKPDPPLETIWFFSSLAFHSNDSPKKGPLDQLLAVKDLFQSVTTCSASCSSSKSIVLIAPVIYEFHSVIVDLKGKDLSLKREKKLRKEIKSFIDEILGYLNLCCSEETNDDEEEGLIRPLCDLASVWLKDNVDGNGGGKELMMFFPLMSDSVIEEMSNGDCDVNELAGVVIAEAFLLKLCLSFLQGRPRVELQKELRTWAVGSISGFQNIHFFAVLMKVLLERGLPVTSLLSPEDETFLRKVLYDAVILVDYSFLHTEKVAHLQVELLKNVFVTRLIVTHEAIELFRENGDHSKFISYINAFSSSHLPSQLVKCVTTEIGVEGEGKGPKGSSPKALLKWLLNLEDEGVMLFDNIVSKHRARLQIDNIKAESDKVDDEKSEKELLFFIDNKGKLKDGVEDDKEASEPMSAAFVAAAHSMQSAEDGKGKKRKQRKGSRGKKNQIKFQRHNLSDESGQKPPDKDGLSSGSDVEDPLGGDEQ